MRPLRDRVGEAIRRSRVGAVRPLWFDLPDDTKEDYRKSADWLIGHLAKELGYTVSEIEPAGDGFDQ